MLTRSQSKLREQECMKREMIVNIDFDEASREWRKNKNILKNGMYSYKKGKHNCCHIENDKKCRKKQLIDSPYCQNHFN